MAGWDTARDNIVAALVALGGVIPPPGVPEPTNYSFIDRLAFYLYGLGTDAVLNDLNDVVITAPVADNEVLAYDTGTSRWINQTAAEAGLSVVGHTHDDRYYTEVELDAGQLDNRYYTEVELDAGQLDNRYYTEAEIDAFGFARKALNEVITGTWNFSNKLGVGTATVPHGAVGSGIVAIEGANLSNTVGPTVQFTTVLDDYPLFSIVPRGHDNVQLGFDAYFHSDGLWRSSDVGTNFNIIKNQDQLQFLGEHSIAQGGQITWDVICYFYSLGGTVWGMLFPGINQITFRDGSQYIRSTNANYLDFYAATAIQMHADVQMTSNNILAIASLTMNEDAWIGRGVLLERLVFDGTGGVIRITDSDLGFNAATAQIRWSANELITSYDVNHLDLDAAVSIDLNAAVVASGSVTATSFIIGGDTLDTTEWGWLNGQDQSVFSTSSPTFAGLALTGDILLAANGIGNDNPILTFAAGVAGEATFAGDVDVAVGKVYRVNSVQVVGAQQVVEADIADTSGTDSDGTCRSKVNALLAKLRTHGLIDT